MNSIAVAAALALVLSTPLLQAAEQKSLDRPRLEDLYAEQTLHDVALSPSGRYLAAVHRQDKSYHIQITDLESGQGQLAVKVHSDFAGPKTTGAVVAVYWKTDDRLLFRTRVVVAEHVASYLSNTTINRLGDRLFAVNRDGTKLVRLLGGPRTEALSGSLDLGNIASWLPHDPEHVLMIVNGRFGLALARVDLTTGAAEIVEPPSESVVGWWVDTAGVPLVRVQWTGALVFSRRDSNGAWEVFHRMRRKELKKLPEFEPVGASDQPGKHYVLARPEGKDRVGLYLYDIQHRAFGDTLLEHPQYDLMSAQISRDGRKVLRYCYIADVRTCEFQEAEINAHMRGIQRYFANTANTAVYDAADDGKTIVLLVDGPSQAPAFHVYRKERKNLALYGELQQSLAGKSLPSAMIVRWKSADGLELRGYLTTPAGTSGARQLPLIVMPHGGPEARDQLEFDAAVQYFAMRGYAVFQPNFRGSEGFGEAFARRGDGEWGRKMQDDVNDGLRTLIESGVADPKRVCIVGASYGGYVALAAATQTPDVYRCAVSVAGISDLAMYLKSRRQRFGAKSEVYEYWRESIGDPERDADRIRATSPVNLAANVRVPILLMHGDLDGIVPLEQSQLMKKALDQQGKASELVVVKNEGHEGWSVENQKKRLLAIDQFLWSHLGPGHGIDTPPPTYQAPDDSKRRL